MKYTTAFISHLVHLTLVFITLISVSSLNTWPQRLYEHTTQSLLTTSFIVYLCSVPPIYLQGDWKVSSVLSTFAKGVVSCATGTFIAFLFAILFGAPFFLKIDQTLAWSLLVGVLIGAPAAHWHALTPLDWRRVFLLNQHKYGGELYLMHMTVLTALGAWLGALVIPLDWDKPWQRWPVCSTIGAVLGQLAVWPLLVVFGLFAREDADKATKKE